MAIALRAAGTFNHAGSGNIVPGLPAGTAAGDILFLCINSADNITSTLPDPTPQFRSTGTKSAGTTGALTVTEPLGITTGDLEILVATTLSGGSMSLTSNGGSAWTSLGSSTCTSGEDMWMWWRVRQAGDTTPQVTPGSDHSCAGIIGYKSGTFDSTTPISNWTTSNENTSDTSFSWAPGFSTTPDFSLVCVVSTSGFDSNTAQVPVCTNASLSSLASRANYETLNGGGGGFGYTEGTLAAHGAVGTFACTYANASPKAYAAFSINPDPNASAWTKIVEANNGTEQRFTVAWKRAVTGETAPTVTHTGGDTIGAQIYGFTGCLASGDVIAQTGAIGSGSGSGTPYTLTATGITPTYTNSGILFVAAGNQTAATGGTGGGNWASWSGTDPTFTEIGDNLAQDGTNEAGLGAAWGLTTDGAATGSRTVALSNVDGGAHVWQALLIEFQDASPTSPGAAVIPDIVMAPPR